MSTNLSISASSLGLSATSTDITKTNGLLQGVLIAIYSVIFLLGVSGNSLVVFVVIRRKNMQSITNLFIANLAVSDILMSCVATPFTPFALLSSDWFLPAALCKVLPLVMGVSVYVSTLTSTAIAVDRYFVIVNPFVERMEKWLCGLVIVYVWIVGTFISLPLAVYQNKQPRQNMPTTSVCHEQWPQASSREVFTIASFCMQFVIPCCVITYCYYQVSQVLQRRCLVKIGSSSITTHRRREVTELRRKHRTNKMLIAMIVIFVVCWIPLNCWWIVNDIKYAIEQQSLRQQFQRQYQMQQMQRHPMGNYSNVNSSNVGTFYSGEMSTGFPRQLLTVMESNNRLLSERMISSTSMDSHSTYHNLIFFICHILAMSSALYNPFLYAGLNENFLAEFRNVLPFLFRRCQRNTSPSTDMAGFTECLPLAVSGTNMSGSFRQTTTVALVPRERPTSVGDIKILMTEGNSKELDSTNRNVFSSGDEEPSQPADSKHNNGDFELSPLQKEHIVFIHQ